MPLPAAPLPLRVLYFNHHDDSRLVMARLLAAHGVEVVTARTCLGAMARWEEAGRAFDAAMGRWGMPDGDGLATLSEMKRRYGCATVAALSCPLAYYGRSYDPATLDYRVWIPLSLDTLVGLFSVVARELGRAVPVRVRERRRAVALGAA